MDNSITQSDSQTIEELKAYGVPAHIGIIMDGNGRWAKKRGLPRTAGHKEGLTSAKKKSLRQRQL